MSEKTIAQQPAGFVGRGKTSRRKTANLVRARPGGKLLLSRAGEAEDARDRGQNRKSRLKAKDGREISATHSADSVTLQRGGDSNSREHFPMGLRNNYHASGKREARWPGRARELVPALWREAK
jgi:hypothetical protein